MLPAMPLLLGYIVGQRISELWVARRNTRRLMAQGAVEVGRGHYPLFVLLHVSWLLAMAVLIPVDATPNAFLLAAFVALQAARYWTMFSLGRFWTTRIITLPGAPLVRRGPYAFVRHPNYLVVAGEIAIVPLIFGAWRIALIFSVLSALLTIYRINVEESALSDRVTDEP